MTAHWVSVVQQILRVQYCEQLFCYSIYPVAVGLHTDDNLISRTSAVLHSLSGTSHYVMSNRSKVRNQIRYLSFVPPILMQSWAGPNRYFHHMVRSTEL